MVNWSVTLPFESQKLPQITVENNAYLFQNGLCKSDHFENKKCGDYLLHII